MSKISELKTLAHLILRRRFIIQLEMAWYDVPHIPLKKIWNYILIQFNRLFYIPRVLGMPYKLQVEPFFGCNLQCPGCPAIDPEAKRAKGPLDLDVYKKFIDAVGDYALFLRVWSWGEPLLHPRLPEMITYAKQKNIIVITSTNANVPRDDDYLRRLVASGLDMLIIAIDGVDQATYSAFRKKGQLERLIDFTRRMVALKKDMGLREPILNLRMVVTRQNEHQITQLKKLAAELGVDILTLKTLNPSQDMKTVLFDIMPEEKKYHRYAVNEEEGTIVPRRRKRRCSFPWNQATLFSDGEIVGCEFDHQYLYPFGNLKDASFGEIWQGEAAHRFRRDYVKSRDSIEFCRLCPYQYMIPESCTVEKFVVGGQSPSV
ncbi:MAG: SPASM domain-containing protein [Acidobacteria bacterium]|nr:SPASM domain-containing protein [Acidobacteriota bacterium]